MLATNPKVCLPNRCSRGKRVCFPECTLALANVCRRLRKTYLSCSTAAGAASTAPCRAQKRGGHTSACCKHHHKPPSPLGAQRDQPHHGQRHISVSSDPTYPLDAQRQRSAASRIRNCQRLLPAWSWQLALGISTPPVRVPYLSLQSLVVGLHAEPTLSCTSCCCGPSSPSRRPRSDSACKTTAA